MIFYPIRSYSFVKRLVLPSFPVRDSKPESRGKRMSSVYLSTETVSPESLT